MCGSAAPEHELEEVFGVGYPPDPALQISEPQISELPDKLTTIRQTVALVSPLIVLVTGLIANTLAETTRRKMIRRSVATGRIPRA